MYTFQGKVVTGEKSNMFFWIVAILIVSFYGIDFLVNGFAISSTAMLITFLLIIKPYGTSPKYSDATCDLIIEQNKLKISWREIKHRDFTNIETIVPIDIISDISYSTEFNSIYINYKKDIADTMIKGTKLFINKKDFYSLTFQDTQADGNFKDSDIVANLVARDVISMLESATGIKVKIITSND